MEEHFVCDEAVAKRGILRMRAPIQRGKETNWDDLERVWKHVFNDQLRVAPEEHPLLAAWPLEPGRPSSREQLLRIMFETFQVPAM
jgi:actin